LKNKLGNTLVSKKLVGEDNWSGGEGTGYYSSNLKHADLVKRLLMYGAATGTQCDIPLGNVEAYLDDPYAQAPAMRAVGANAMNRNPRH